MSLMMGGAAGGGLRFRFALGLAGAHLLCLAMSLLSKHLLTFLKGEPFLWHVSNPTLIIEVGSSFLSNFLLFNLFGSLLLLLFFIEFFSCGFGLGNSWVWCWLSLFLGSRNSFFLSLVSSLICGNLLFNVRLWSWNFNLWFGWIR